MADEAGRGYDVDTILRRPAAAGISGRQCRVRAAGPERKRALLIRAAAEHVSVPEVIRRAIGEYLRAS